MEDTIQPQPARESKYNFRSLDPSRPASEQRIIFDEAAKQLFRELPHKSGLGFKIDTLQICLEVRGKA